MHSKANTQMRCAQKLVTFASTPMVIKIYTGHTITLIKPGSRMGIRLLLKSPPIASVAVPRCTSIMPSNTRANLSVCVCVFCPFVGTLARGTPFRTFFFPPEMCFFCRTCSAHPTRPVPSAARGSWAKRWMSSEMSWCGW